MRKRIPGNLKRQKRKLYTRALWENYLGRLYDEREAVYSALETDLTLGRQNRRRLIMDLAKGYGPYLTSPDGA